MWAIKTSDDFNFSHLILRYLFDCSIRKDIGYLSYGMILMPFFQKEKIKLNEEMQTIMPNTTTMIIVSNLYKMHLTLSDNGRWVRAHICHDPNF